MTALTCVSSAAPACSVCSFISMTFSMNILFFPHCQAMEGPGTPGSLQHPWDPISLGLGIARTLDTAGMLDAAGMLPGFRLPRQLLLSLSALVCIREPSTASIWSFANCVRSEAHQSGSFPQYPSTGDASRGMSHPRAAGLLSRAVPDHLAGHLFLWPPHSSTPTACAG